MALTPETVIKGLGFVRYLYELALQQSRQPGFRSATTILTFHDAVEMFLVFCLQHCDVYSAKKRYLFADYWTDLAKVGINIAQQGTMESLSRARGNFKHHALMPPLNTVEDARVHVREFLIENTSLVFKLDFNNISLVNLVHCDAARTRLQVAEGQLLQQQYGDAMGEIAIAFRALIDDFLARSRDEFGRSAFAFQDSEFWGSLRFRWAGRGAKDDIPRYVEQELQNFSRDVGREFEALRNGLKIVSLGLDYRRYVRFIALTPFVVGHGRGQYGQSERRRDTPPTLEECRFCLDFVIESAMRVQET